MDLKFKIYEMTNIDFMNKKSKLFDSYYDNKLRNKISGIVEIKILIGLRDEVVKMVHRQWLREAFIKL